MDIECRGSTPVINLLCCLFAESFLKKIRVFHWIPQPKDKLSELGEKGWIQLCNSINTVPCPHLVSIWIPNNAIGEKGCKEFARLCFANRFGEIKEIDFSGNRIGNGGVIELFHAIQVAKITSQLQILDIRDNNITSRGMKTAYGSIKCCDFANLEVLRLGGTSEKWTEDGIDF